MKGFSFDKLINDFREGHVYWGEELAKVELGDNWAAILDGTISGDAAKNEYFNAKRYKNNINRLCL